MRRSICAGVTLLLLVSTPALAQSPKRSELRREIGALRAQLNELERQLLEPSPEDFAGFAGYRDQSDRGLIRLLPRERYDKADAMTMRGGGAYYSFTRRTHEYGYGSDISLSNRTLSVGFAGADYGLLVAVPGATIDTIGPDHPAARELISLSIPATEREVREEQTRTSLGFTAGGYVFGRRIGAQAGTTYVLRSISFDTSDVVVCLQALREDEDGSFVFAWRLLERNPPPTFVRAAH